MSTSSPSATVEDYLKALYQLSQHGDAKVRTSDIAARLNISLPSVTIMMKAMAERGFVERTAYKGMSLTERGEHEALKVIRKHRLIEVFLVQVLNYRWDEVHEDAELLEHAMSDRLTNRIDQYLGFPRVDPHGDPIPDANGDITRTPSASLLEAPLGTSFIIQRVTDQRIEALQFLGERGIQPGARITIDRLDPFDGPVWIRLDHEEIALSRRLARCIHVDSASQAP